MNPNHKLALTLIAGAVLGAATIQGLHAQATQAKRPVIVVVEIEDVTDPAGFKAVTQDPMRSTSTATVTQLGGRFISRAANITALDGAPPKRSIVIAFDDAAKAQLGTIPPTRRRSMKSALGRQSRAPTSSRVCRKIRRSFAQLMKKVSTGALCGRRPTSTNMSIWRCARRRSFSVKVNSMRG